MRWGGCPPAPFPPRGGSPPSPKSGSRQRERPRRLRPPTRLRAALCRAPAPAGVLWIAGLDCDSSRLGRVPSFLPTPRPAAIQTPLGPPPPCTSPGRELQDDGAQFPEYPASISRPQKLRPGGGVGAQKGQRRRGSGSPGPAARLQVSTSKRLCNSQKTRSRGRLGKQAEPINKATWPPGWGGRAKSRSLFRQQRAAASGPG